jgi:site-specific recombinase XerD
MTPPMHKPDSLAEQYDQTLHFTRDKHLPADFIRPQPTAFWPPENLALYERYRDWLLSGGTSEMSSKIIYLPVAGHVFGLNLKPHPQINISTSLNAGLGSDLERVMEYAQAKGSRKDWLKACRNGLNLFRRFLRLERGLGEESKARSFDIAAHTQGMPQWLVLELERYQHVRQRNWRAARLEQNIRRFWSGHLRVWGFLVQQRQVQSLGDLKRQHILDYIDVSLQANYSPTTVNNDLRCLHSLLLFLQDEGYTVPQSLLRIPSLKQPDSLPKYLTDEQVKKLRDEIEHGVQAAQLNSHRRLALLVRAAFYLLWQGGMRIGEVEELRLEDLDLSARLNAGLPGGRLSVRNGKGLKDRTIYLTETTIQALQGYLAVRGESNTQHSDHVFLYRNAPLKNDLIRNQLLYLGQRVGIKVYPHRLRHTCATQLLNVGCRITSIQRFLGHKKLNTTMIYAHAHDQNVAEDYFAAMQRVEQRLDTSAVLNADIVPTPKEEPKPEGDIVYAPPIFGEPDQVLVWVERLALPELCQQERLEIAEHLKQTLSLGFACQLSPPIMAIAG